MDYTALDDIMEREGASRNPALEATLQEDYNRLGMNTGGPFMVTRAYVKGDVVVEVQENVTPEDLGGYTASVTHPAVAVVRNDDGRVTCAARDHDLVADLVVQMSA